MEQVFYIDLMGISGKDELHALLQKELPLPAYYGCNLDAFYDVLTDKGEGWNIIFYNCSKMAVARTALDENEITDDIKSYFQSVRKMCSRAASECFNLKIRFFP